MSSGGRSEIKVPALGESIQEATVARWLKSVGDLVKMDEVLVELETDKVTLEVIAPASGILAEVRVEKGSSVCVGDVLGMVTEAAEGVKPEGNPQAAHQQTQQQPANASGLKIAVASMVASATHKVASTVQSTLQKAATMESVASSVRKLAEEMSIDSKNAPERGKDGSLTKGDILNLAEGAAIVVEQSISSPTEKVSPPVRTSDRREERVKMSRLRQRIAERLKYAQNTAAILTTFNEVDMSAINALRTQYKESFEKKYGIRLGMMSFFVKACIQALKEFPAVNSEIEGDEIIYKNYYDIGVAVSTPQGLVVPVVRDTDTLGFAELETAIASLAQKARDGKLSIEEITGGTFTVSNGGIFGSLLATPILNPPQTGILGMHKIEDRPVAIRGKVEIRPMMYLALSYDHRVIDGRESVSFLVKVKESLENPERLLLDM